MSIGSRLCRSAATLAMACGLVACGGSPEPVTEVRIPGLKYTGKVAALTVELSGHALDNAIKVNVEGHSCTVGPVTSAMFRTALCFIAVPATLQLPVEVRSGSDYLVYSTVVKVPAPQVTFTTTRGDFVIELDPAAAPITVKNFLSYVNKTPSFYDETIFHRVDPDVNHVVQAGGFRSGLIAKTGLADPITLESNNGLKNLRYTVGMARNNEFNSATSQFYVNLRDNTGFDYVNSSRPGYAVFGRVVSGWAVIDTIASQPTTTVEKYNNVPVTDITITSATQTQ